MRAYYLIKVWSLVNETINRLTCAVIHCLTFKVVDYNAQIGESGEHFNETIEVDTERQTELFKVPAHGNVDHSNILNDFKTVSIVTITRKNMLMTFSIDPLYCESSRQRCN